MHHFKETRVKIPTCERFWTRVHMKLLEDAIQ